MSEDFDWWDNCAVADCPNKCCLRLDSDRCWPHTVGAPLDWQDGLAKHQRKERRKQLEKKWFNAGRRVLSNL